MKMKLPAMVMALLMILNAIPAFAATPAIQRTEYEGNGVVEVDFRRDVQYRNAKVLVKDSSGKFYTAKITDRDSGDMTFRVSDIDPGKTYAYQISGVRSGGSGSYVKVTGKFTAPKVSALSIIDADCDASDRELDLEFNGRVQYKNAKVKVRDRGGKFYTARIVDKDSDSMEIYVKGLKRGTKYAVQVSGVRMSGASDYGKVVKTFTAR